MINRYAARTISTASGTWPDFNTFDNDTRIFLIGSKNGTTSVTSKSIVTILGHCDKRYSGIADVYAELCETAHPNFEGLYFGYSKLDRQALITSFSNRWMELYGKKHLDLMRLCMSTFEFEYDRIWPKRFEQLEQWVEANAAELQASKPSGIEQE